jgi:hypothetical protein
MWPIISAGLTYVAKEYGSTVLGGVGEAVAGEPGRKTGEWLGETLKKVL